MSTTVDDGAKGTRVLVTGATGYIAGWLVKRLLDAGAIVHAAVRDPEDTARLAHLSAMAEDAPGTLTFFAADLLSRGSFDAAMAGCEVVFHTASPFLLEGRVSDPQRELVDPAVQGTTTVLESANRTESVRRVVLTSSLAAISGGPADNARAPGGVLDESCWNSVSTLDSGAYLYSKLLAERAAWEMAEAQSRWRLVVINPGLVLGPAASAATTSASFDLVAMLADGTCRNGAPPRQMGMVDVRDVAEAHFLAAFVPAAEGRHLNFEAVYSFSDLAGMLKTVADDRWPIPDPSPLPEGTQPYRADNSKAKTALGLNYRPVAPAVVAMFQQLVETGRLAPPT